MKLSISFAFTFWFDNKVPEAIYYNDFTELF